MVRGRVKDIIKENARLLPICLPYSPNFPISMLTKSVFVRLGMNTHIQNEIQKLKYTAATNNLGYLTANQAYLWHRMFLVHRDLIDERWADQLYRKPTDYKAYINPVLLTTSGPTQQIYEKCSNFPGVSFRVKRFLSIELEYKNEQKQRFVEQASGFRALVLQHCMNHIDGQLSIDQEVSQGRATFDAATGPAFPKTSFLFKQFSIRIKLHGQKVASGQSTPTDINHLKMKTDYLSRIQVAYSEELRTLQARLK